MFIIGDWNAKVGSQEIPGVTGKLGLGVQNEAGQRLTEFCQENTLLIANTLFQQQEWRLYTWTSPDGQHQNQTDYILCSQRWRSSIQSAKTRLVADCGSDHELLIAKFRLKLKNVGKTTRPFRYDLNQIPYDYTVGLTNRFKRLDLIDRVPEELWMEVCDIVREAAAIGGRRRRGRQRMRWLGDVTDSMDMSLSKLREVVMDSESWRAAAYGVANSQSWLSDWTDWKPENPMLLPTQQSSYWR